MKFSEVFRINRTEEDEWFDPILSIDTPLFLDPFLLYLDERDEFVGSHDEIVSLFDDAFRLISIAGGNPASFDFKKATRLLLFPEVEELCLGYTASGTKGSGSGKDLANSTAAALWEAVVAGLIDLKHFEQISILRVGIGPDRISDITSGIIRHRLAAYTLRICQRHDVPTRVVRHPAGVYNTRFQRWIPAEWMLPQNPYTKKPILLVPRRYLRDLPVINTDDFWDYCEAFENDTIRHEISQDITGRVSKEEIVAIAKKHPDLCEAYVKYRECNPASAYDIHKDVKGFVQWYDASKAYCGNHPLRLEVSESSDFFAIVDRMLQEYRHFIEENSGWKLLWNDNGLSKSEKATQLMLLGIVKHYCQANDIDVSPETNVGRGPVDFKVSRGHRLRALIEVKLARNTKFWNGIRQQLQTYLHAEGVNVGYFVVVAFTDQDMDRVRDISKVVDEINQVTPYSLRTMLVDARSGKLSASKL